MSNGANRNACPRREPAPLIRCVDAAHASGTRLALMGKVCHLPCLQAEQSSVTVAVAYSRLMLVQHFHLETASEAEGEARGPPERSEG